MKNKYNVGNRVWFIYGETNHVYSGTVKKIEDDGNAIGYNILADENTEFPVKADKVFGTKLDAVNSKFKEVGGCRRWSIGVGQFGQVRVEFDHYPNVGTLNLYDANPDELRKIGHMFLNAAEDFNFLCDMKNIDE